MGDKASKQRLQGGPVSDRKASEVAEERDSRGEAPRLPWVVLPPGGYKQKCPVFVVGTATAEEG